MLSLNTNTTSLMVQRNLSKATEGINRAMMQLTTGYRLNSAKDNPANYAIAKNMETKIHAWDVAQSNMSMGYDMLEVASSSAELIGAHLSRIRDLCEQACNGTYGEQSVNAIKAEIQGRLDEINRIRANTEYNDIKLFGEICSDGSVTPKTVDLQIGIDSSTSSRLTVETTLNLSGLNDIENWDITSSDTLDKVDSMLNELWNYEVNIGASQNRIEYALESSEVIVTNLTSSLSTIRDADIAKASSDLIRYQILQQACATLLATANQMPAMALQLL